MLNSRIKDKIYAFLSFLAIVLAIGSFAFTVNFLMKVNKYIFSVNEQTVKAETISADKMGFEKIKEKLMTKEGGEERNIPADTNVDTSAKSAPESFQENSSDITGNSSSEVMTNDVLIPSTSPISLPGILPASSPKAAGSK